MRHRYVVATSWVPFKLKARRFQGSLTLSTSSTKEGDDSELYVSKKIKWAFKEGTCDELVILCTYTPKIGYQRPHLNFSFQLSHRILKLMETEHFLYVPLSYGTAF